MNTRSIAPTSERERPVAYYRALREVTRHLQPLLQKYDVDLYTQPAGPAIVRRMKLSDSLRAGEVIARAVSIRHDFSLIELLFLGVYVIKSSGKLPDLQALQETPPATMLQDVLESVGAGEGFSRLVANTPDGAPETVFERWQRIYERNSSVELVAQILEACDL